MLPDGTWVRAGGGCATAWAGTGTMMACMAVLAGVPATGAVGWARAHYTPRAVETGAQRRWVLRFGELVSQAS